MPPETDMRGGQNDGGGKLADNRPAHTGGRNTRNGVTGRGEHPSQRGGTSQRYASDVPQADRGADTGRGYQQQQDAHYSQNAANRHNQYSVSKSSGPQLSFAVLVLTFEVQPRAQQRPYPGREERGAAFAAHDQQRGDSRHPSPKQYEQRADTRRGDAVFPEWTSRARYDTARPEQRREQAMTQRAQAYDSRGIADYSRAMNPPDDVNSSASGRPMRQWGAKGDAEANSGDSRRRPDERVQDGVSGADAYRRQSDRGDRGGQDRQRHETEYMSRSQSRPHEASRPAPAPAQSRDRESFESRGPALRTRDDEHGLAKRSREPISKAANVVASSPRHGGSGPDWGRRVASGTSARADSSASPAPSGYGQGRPPLPPQGAPGYGPGYGGSRGQDRYFDERRLPPVRAAYDQERDQYYRGRADKGPSSGNDSHGRGYAPAPSGGSNRERASAIRDRDNASHERERGARS